MSSSVRRLCTTTVALALCLGTVPLAAAAAAPEAPSLPTPGATAAAQDSGPQFRAAGAPASPHVSPRSAQRTAAAAPGSVAELTAARISSTYAVLTWQPAADGGSPLTAYSVQTLRDGVVVDEAPDWDPTATAIRSDDLEPDAAYEFRIAAVNALGTGEYVSVSFTTTHSGADRIYGADRYETAVQVSQDAFRFEGVPAAFIASGRNFPDALSAAAAAGGLDGPVLLTLPGSLSQGAADELASLKPEYLLAAGGTSAVSGAVFKKAAASATQGSHQFAGKNRYDTAAQISRLWSAPTSTVYLASGTDYPDALAGAAAAGLRGAPVLLTRNAALPAETAAALRRLAPSKIIALGGKGAVSDAVLASAKAATRTTTSTARLWGASRYDTAVKISAAAFPARVPVVYVASGRNFADALAGAAAGGSLGGPVLLAYPTSIPDAALAEIKRLDPVRVIVLGGPSVVSDAVLESIQSTLGIPQP